MAEAENKPGETLKTEWGTIDLEPLRGETVEHNLVKREGWGAQEPKGELKPLVHPVKYVASCVNTGVAECKTMDECMERMRELQKKHMEKGMPDMHYNFAVGGDGNLYEGRGWQYQPESLKEQPEWDEKCISVAYLGDLDEFNTTNPFGEFIDIIYLAQHGVDKGYIAEDYEMVEDTQKFE